MLYRALTSALGYADAPLYCEDDGERLVSSSDRHWLRAARAAGVRGSYLFRTSPDPEALRPAVHVAEAQTLEDARIIHARLWNQGVHPFVIIILPNQVRVFTGFAYHPDDEEIGTVARPAGRQDQILEALSAFTADAINRGEIWRVHAHHLRSETRVDTTLLAQLRNLSEVLQKSYGLLDRTCHSLIGKFVYLSYLRARNVLSDKWLRDEAQIEPAAIFAGPGFSGDITLQSFRQLARAVEKRFNGLLFPIPWGSPRGPRADAIRQVARVFAGEDDVSGQLHLPFTAYDFSSIPVEFISSIYEQFLHEVRDKDGDLEGNVRSNGSDASDPEKRGAHYTPEPLAEYLVSEVSTVKPLKLVAEAHIAPASQARIRILDPCCGSGVFLVVAYRRIIELECYRQERGKLNAAELRDVLVNSIFAVERNPTACQIAAFSLILTLLSYVDPPELHARKNFKFPKLIGNNLFRQDFFDDSKAFWKLADPKTEVPMRFDWIIGNPPWVEIDAKDPREKHLREWTRRHDAEYGLARDRTGEAFAWKVMDCLADGGVVGLILHAKTLTNDHLKIWRQKFFGGTHVHRLTNLANLAYVIFPSAQQPAITVVYSRKTSVEPLHVIQHFGPFVANQATVSDKGKGKSKHRSWTIGFSESEIKEVAASEAASGDASVWKFALWGNHRDRQAVKRLQRVLSTTLGDLVQSRGWHLALGLQLKPDKGSKEEPNTYIKELEALPVFDHKSFLKSGGGISVPEKFLIENTHGCFVRGKRISGVSLVKGPHLFLWNTFATYSETDFIIRHDKIGLAGGTIRGLKAVAAIWSSSITSYLLFFITNAAWGVAYSTIDLGDAERLPFPELSLEREQKLADAWDDATAEETKGRSLGQVKDFLDRRVAEALGIPATISSVVREFFQVRYQLNKGKSPKHLREIPNDGELTAYSLRLRDELDGFVGLAARHAIRVLYSAKAISVSIRIEKGDRPVPLQIHRADGQKGATLDALLRAAEAKFTQWVYVKRSVRIFDGDTIHLIKPPRRIEWTETQAMLDAGDIIAEVIEAKGRAS